MSWDREKERKASKAVGIGSSIFAVVFMVIWCGIAVAMGAWFMLIFGLPMLSFMVFRVVVLVKKSKAEAQKEPWEQPDRSEKTYDAPRTHRDGFCPYCGRELSDDFTFCPTCGRRL